MQQSENEYKLSEIYKQTQYDKWYITVIAHQNSVQRIVNNKSAVYN